jgi:hypothetical protein
VVVVAPPTRRVLPRNALPPRLFDVRRMRSKADTLVLAHHERVVNSAYWSPFTGDASLHFSRHTSHVTRHTSHVTRHTSHVTRHTSHVTRHTSHLTRHTSHVTRHTSHVTFAAGRYLCSTGQDNRIQIFENFLGSPAQVSPTLLITTMNP